ncbi:hypothetical protein [Kordiimonas sp.]|uniref:hypothetical protein n=1 Tax=Kordiimonas sp. TaxID=1970157 RepID=UPI003A917158
MLKRLNVYIDQSDPAAAVRLSHALRYEKSVNLVPASGGGMPEGELYEFLYDHAVDVVFAPSGAGEIPHYLKEQGYNPKILAPSRDALTAVRSLVSGSNTGQGDHDYLVDCYTDFSGDLRYRLVQLVQQAEAALRVTPVLKAPYEVEMLADVLNVRYKPRGGWYFRATKVDGGELRLASLNLSGLDGASLSRLRGANFPALMLFEVMGHDIGFLLQKDLPCSALFDEAGVHVSASPEHDRVFFDLDDTLIIHGQVNPEAISFLQRCRENKKPVTLITRHYREPGITLAEFGIDPALFSQMVWITDGSSKASHIPPDARAIFVDDAYKERLDVAANSACAVFAPDAIPALQGGIMQELFLR